MKIYKKNIDKNSVRLLIWALKFFHDWGFHIFERCQGNEGFRKSILECRDIVRDITGVTFHGTGELNEMLMELMSEEEYVKWK